MTWEIFLGITAIVAFIFSVTGPMLKLNTSITKLNDCVDTLQKALDKIEDDNEKSHGRIWEHNDAQDSSIENHEHRISAIEQTMEITEKLHPELTGIGTFRRNDKK